MLRDESISVHEEVTFDSGSTSWKEIDRALRRIAERRAALDAEEARWIREALRGEIWLELGMVSMLEYLEARLGYGPRAAQDRIRVALALDELPAIARTLQHGELSFSAVRELTRVATPKTEHAWCDAARRKNVHEIEELVSGRRRGDLPSDPDRPDPNADDTAIRDATLALTTAGYSRREAIAAVETAAAHVDATNLDALVREALRRATG